MVLPGGGNWTPVSTQPLVKWACCSLTNGDAVHVLTFRIMLPLCLQAYADICPYGNQWTSGHPQVLAENTDFVFF